MANEADGCIDDREEYRRRHVPHADPVDEKLESRSVDPEKRCVDDHVARRAGMINRAGCERESSVQQIACRVRDNERRHICQQVVDSGESVKRNQYSQTDGEAQETYRTEAPELREISAHRGTVS